MATKTRASCICFDLDMAGLLCGVGSHNHHRDLSAGYGHLIRDMGPITPIGVIFAICYGVVFTFCHSIPLVRSYGLKQKFITPHCPQQNGMVERVILTLKEQCIHHHRFESIQHAARVIGDRIGFYKNRRPHQALAMHTPDEAFKLAAMN